MNSDGLIILEDPSEVFPSQEDGMLPLQMLQKPVRYPIPKNEVARLATLRRYQVLDTEPEDRFDDLTRLACQICHTPIALISLVDGHRQWFKSKIGLEICQTPREVSFCAHAIMSEELFVVPDACRDPRFERNPLVVRKPHIRFYAGAPLKAPNGSNLGVLCVVDRIPRQMGIEQLESLRILSRQVMAQVLWARDSHALKTALREKEDLEHYLQRLTWTSRYSGR